MFSLCITRLFHTILRYFSLPQASLSLLKLSDCSCNYSSRYLFIHKPLLCPLWWSRARIVAREFWFMMIKEEGKKSLKTRIHRWGAICHTPTGHAAAPVLADLIAKIGKVLPSYSGIYLVMYSLNWKGTTNYFYHERNPLLICKIYLISFFGCACEYFKEWLHTICHIHRESGKRPVAKRE